MVELDELAGQAHVTELIAAEDFHEKTAVILKDFWLDNFDGINLGRSDSLFHLVIFFVAVGLGGIA